MSAAKVTVPQEKEKPSRLARRRRKEARYRRRLLAAAAAVVAIVLTVGAAWDIPYINAARKTASWLNEKLRGDREGGGAAEPRYLFLTHPQTGKVLSGEVSVLWGIYPEEGGRNSLVSLCLVSCDVEAGRASLFFVPEVTVAYNARGGRTDLRRVLQEEGSEDILRSTVQNMTGASVDYLVLCSFRRAVETLQELELPPLTLREDATFTDPLTGNTQRLFAGQKIGDADRLLFYLLATDRGEAWDAYYARRERAEDYLPVALEVLCSRGEDCFPGERLRSDGELRLIPGAPSHEKDALYLASMLQAAVDLGRESLTCRAAPRVEVLNGCGVPELGKKVGERLSSLGVPLAGTGGNAKTLVNGEEVNDFGYQKSVIVCRSAEPRVAAYAAYLGVLLSIGEVKREGGPGPEMAVIAGRDMAQ